MAFIDYNEQSGNDDTIAYYISNDILLGLDCKRAVKHKGSMIRIRPEVKRDFHVAYQRLTDDYFEESLM